MPFLYANTSCTSSIYTAVPAKMDTSVFRFHRCSSAVAATAMASGSPWLPDRMSIVVIQRKRMATEHTRVRWEMFWRSFRAGCG